MILRVECCPLALWFPVVWIVLPILRAAKDVLLEKHPPGIHPKPSVLLDPPMQAPHYDPILFESLTGDVIKWASLHTHGAAGPSGVDAYCWRCMCTSFKEASTGLCKALASVARYFCTIQLKDPAVMMPFVACRLIPLDKNPGVCPIGIGDVPRRIVAKATLFVIGEDVVSAAGPLQTCAGHAAGSEAAVHTMKELFDKNECEAALLVDASNAFNCINRQAALHNISVLCPSFSTILHNTYGAPVRLFIVGEGEIPSLEGTTQGDPLAMAMYALAVVPMIRCLRNDVPAASQVWFADDATAVGSLSTLLTWWQHLSSIGPVIRLLLHVFTLHTILKMHTYNHVILTRITLHILGYITVCTSFMCDASYYTCPFQMKLVHKRLLYRRYLSGGL